ncbi:MAG: hypothetical protein ACYC2U_06950 [Candidatus Amoebophilus sp.]
MKKNHLRSILIISLTVIATHSCSCDNPKAPSTTSKPTNAKPKAENNQTNPQPPNSSNNNSNISFDSIQKAIAELEESVKNNTATTQLKNVYALLEHLPPKRFKQNADGSLSRINEEKSGKELYIKFIDTIPFAEALYDTNAPELLENIVGWLVENKLLKANEIDEQGNTPLEQLILSFSKKPFNVISLKRMIDAWMKQGAQLTSNKASKLLEELVKNSTFDLKKYTDIVGFLTKQGAQLLPGKASEWLEKLIETPTFFSETYVETISFFTKQGATLKNNAKVTALLQEAVKKQDEKLYASLLKLGADPNIEVTPPYMGEMPFLHMLHGGLDKVKEELFQELIKDSKVNINITNQKGLTLAMDIAYEHNSSTTVIENLLQREDLDINTIKAGDTCSGIKGFTLLDIIIGNCSVIPTGHVWQKQIILNGNKKCLEVLKKMSSHKNYFVNDKNINLATNKNKQLEEIRVPDKIDTDAIAVAKEVLNILQKGPGKF